MMSAAPGLGWFAELERWVLPIYTVDEQVYACKAWKPTGTGARWVTIGWEHAKQAEVHEHPMGRLFGPVLLACAMYGAVRLALPPATPLLLAAPVKLAAVGAFVAVVLLADRMLPTGGAFRFHPLRSALHEVGKR